MKNIKIVGNWNDQKEKTLYLVSLIYALACFYSSAYCKMSCVERLPNVHTVDEAFPG